MLMYNPIKPLTEGFNLNRAESAKLKVQSWPRPLPKVSRDTWHKIKDEGWMVQLDLSSVCFVLLSAVSSQTDACVPK